MKSGTNIGFAEKANKHPHNVDNQQNNLITIVMSLVENAGKNVN